MARAYWLVKSEPSVYPWSRLEAEKVAVWDVVDLEPVKALAREVTLAEMREIKALANMVLLRKSRLSVAPVTKNEFEAVLSAGKTMLT